MIHLHLYFVLYIVCTKFIDLLNLFLILNLISSISNIFELIILTPIFFLEWRHGQGGHLTLQDEDLTTKTVGGWRKLNTLAHYGVKESAVMSLISRQNESYSINHSQSCQNC